MAQLVVLIKGDQNEFSLGAGSLEALARLGVSSVSLARDERTAAVVLEGWALDPSQRDEALAALSAAEGTAHVLQPVAQMAVAAQTNPGGISQ